MVDRSEPAGLLLEDKPTYRRVVASTMVNETAQGIVAETFDLEAVPRSVEQVLSKNRQPLMRNEYQFKLECKVKEQARSFQNLFLSAIESLVIALETKDFYTAGHSRRVCQFALATSRYLGMSTADDMHDLRWGALLHDVGKIAVDRSIQNKPGKLTREEYEQVMTHVPVGVRIVKPIANENIMSIIRFHHVRYDADPAGQAMVGAEIPLGARIVSLADSFDAMTSDRPYRKSLPLAAALSEIVRCAGTQFDPLVADAFLRIPASEIMTIVGTSRGQGGEENEGNVGRDWYAPWSHYQRSTLLV